mmetsp:Transcript_30904/g.33774  ORF Transcript_30904/g.33774 Transcript_30904/m.33774 type:complete len:197 (-) Transcript_30904:47-637(-)
MVTHFALFFLIIVSFIGINHADDESENVKYFGKYRSDEIKSSSNCGTQINWFKNVSAYSNGNYHGTSKPCGNCDYSGALCQYQAFEYCARYFEKNGGVDPSIWKWNYTYNPDYNPCLAYPWPYIVQISGDPLPGDMIVVYLGNVNQGQRYYHSAIVVTTNLPNYVNVIEQNMSPSGSNTYVTPLTCILRANTTNTK